MRHSTLIHDILAKENITSWYQPIINITSNKLVGWECLTRGPSTSALHTADALFQAAQDANMLKPVELMCVRNAVESFEQLSLPGKLFSNTSHELFLAGSHLKKHLKSIAKKSPVSPTKLVVELTAQGATNDLEQLIEAASYFHDLGAQIAIDDLGVGEITHEEWMRLQPDYVKISREYINNIHQDEAKQGIVKSIVSAARSSQTKVIALGVETNAELEVLSELGIYLCQGYLFQRPELAPEVPDLKRFSATRPKACTSTLACDLVINHERISMNTRLNKIAGIFNSDRAYDCLAVFEGGKIQGLLSRALFTELLKQAPQTGSETLCDINPTLETKVFEVDAYTPLHELATKLTGRSRTRAHDNFVVVHEGKILGLGAVVDVMKHLLSESKVRSEASPKISNADERRQNDNSKVAYL